MKRIFTHYVSIILYIFFLYKYNENPCNIFLWLFGQVLLQTKPEIKESNAIAFYDKKWNRISCQCNNFNPNTNELCDFELFLQIKLSMVLYKKY